MTPVVYGKRLSDGGVSGSRPALGVNSAFSEIRDHPVISGIFFPLCILNGDHKWLCWVIVWQRAYGGSPRQTTLAWMAHFPHWRVAPKANQAEGIDDKFVIPYTTALQLTKKKTVPEMAGGVRAGRIWPNCSWGGYFAETPGLDPAPVRLRATAGGADTGMPIVEPVPRNNLKGAIQVSRKAKIWLRLPT